MDLSSEIKFLFLCIQIYILAALGCAYVRAYRPLITIIKNTMSQKKGNPTLASYCAGISQDFAGNKI